MSNVAPTPSEANEKPDGGPAFPMPVTGGEESYARLDELVPANKRHLMGMTLRDYFAAAALTGMLGVMVRGGLSPTESAKAAFNLADAMLTERKR